MAVIEKRGDLQWRVRVRRKGHPAQSATFETKAEAERWAREVESSMAAGRFRDSSHLRSITLRELIRRYRLEVSPTKKGEDREVRRLLQMERDSICDKAVGELESADFRRWRDERMKTVKGDTTIRELNLFSTILNHARSEWDEFHGMENPVRVVKRPKAAKGRERRYKPGEMERIVEVCESAVVRDLIHVAVYTTMRRSEMVNLQWADVHFGDDYLILRDTKNNEGRSVPMMPIVIEILSRRREEAEAGGNAAGGKVFPIQPDTVTQAFGRARDRARKLYVEDCKERGVDPDPELFVNVRLHDARHEGTSQLFEVHGLSMMEVASVTGHKDPRMLKRYTQMEAKRLAQKFKR